MHSKIVVCRSAYTHFSISIHRAKSLMHTGLVRKSQNVPCWNNVWGFSAAGFFNPATSAGYLQDPRADTALSNRETLCP